MHTERTKVVKTLKVHMLHSLYRLLVLGLMLLNTSRNWRVTKLGLKELERSYFYPSSLALMAA
jgi:hypothetical protein